jgi:hypothetical protein
MTMINRTRQKTAETAHLNWMGGPGYFLSDPVKTLVLAASSCFFGEPMYYHAEPADSRLRRRTHIAYQAQLSDSELNRLRETLNAVDPREWRAQTPKQLMEQAIDMALDHDAEATLREAVRLRREEHIRTTPQVILVRAAHHRKVRGPQRTPRGTTAPMSLIDKYAPGIIARADEPSVGLAYQLSEYGRTIPNSLKRAWAKALEGFDAYGLAKYRMESRMVRTADVTSLAHPKGEVIGRLMGPSKSAGGELRATGETWEAIVSAEGSTREAWEKALEHMGHMAVLRNLRNLLDKGIPYTLWLERLEAGAKRGQQLPFWYYSAFKAVEKTAPAPVLDGIERCLELSMGSLPWFEGRVMSLCDNSGSAWGTATSSMGTMHIAQIANLTGAITGKRADEGYVGIFGDRLSVFPVRKQDSVFSTARRADEMGKHIGGSTENGIWLFWDQAIRKRERWDHVFVYSDMQAGHGGLYGTNPKEYGEFLWRKGASYIDVPKLIAEYRTRVNPDVMVYLVQVAGYTDTIVPEFYDRTFILGGWGDGLFRFAAGMTEMYGRN